jgi:aminoglycoside/choline kinase family phosphotransferase
MQLFEDWYLSVHLKHKMTATQLKAWAELRAHLVRQCVQQPQVWVHRDYHSRNLMVLDKNSPGVIDYQDMVIGPLTYDLASIFKDCYIEWPRTQQLEGLQNYQQKLRHAAGEIEQATELSNIDFDQLVKWYDMTALQRHIKVLGIFCRLNYRDNKPNYINDLPMVKRYVLEVLPRYPQLRTFLNEFSSLLN